MTSYLVNGVLRIVCRLILNEQGSNETCGLLSHKSVQDLIVANSIQIKTLLMEVSFTVHECKTIKETKI